MKFREFLGKVLNWLKFPGFVRPTAGWWKLVGTTIDIEVGDMFTTLAVDNKITLYFDRLTGKYDGYEINYKSIIDECEEMKQQDIDDWKAEQIKGLY